VTYLKQTKWPLGESCKIHFYEFYHISISAAQKNIQRFWHQLFYLFFSLHLFTRVPAGVYKIFALRAKYLAEKR
jgi:hypothetical protein